MGKGVQARAPSATDATRLRNTRRNMFMHMNLNDTNARSFGVSQTVIPSTRLTPAHPYPRYE